MTLGLRIPRLLLRFSYLHRLALFVNKKNLFQDPVLSVAASLSFKDAFVIPLGKEDQVEKARCSLAGDSRSDHLMMANVMMKWENSIEMGNSQSFCYR